MQRTEDSRQIKEFRKRQSRQIIAVAIALFCVLLAAVIGKRPDIFGAFSPQDLFAAQVIVIALFIGFTSVNWKCPSCGKHLGGDLFRRTCRKCGARLQ
jgi:tRNA(Ile2) C34 agmatinyltransferase TiaS